MTKFLTVKGKNNTHHINMDQIENVVETENSLVIVLVLGSTRDVTDKTEMENVLGQMYDTVDQRDTKQNYGHSFYHWLSLRKDEDSPIGDLARDTIEDENFPKDTYDLLLVFKYYFNIDSNITGFKDTVKSAINEYLEFKIN